MDLLNIGFDIKELLFILNTNYFIYINIMAFKYSMGYRRGVISS